MALHGTIKVDDKLIGNRNDIIKIYPIEKTDENTYDKLHPQYPFEFKSLFGRIPNLNTAVEYVKYYLEPSYLVTNRLPKHRRPRKGPNKYLLLELIALDRILAEKSLVDYLREDPIGDRKLQIIYRQKKGVLDVEIPEKDRNLNLALRVPANEVSEYFNEVSGDKSVKELDKEEYKALCRDLKSKFFDRLASLSDAPLFVSIDKDVKNDELKKFYLGE